MIDFSIIIPTYNRYKDLEALFNSIYHLQYDLQSLEVIVIDQNDRLSIENIIIAYASKFKIKHIKSKIKNISHAKNMGLDNAVGKIVHFADDDMLYYKDTLKQASMALKKNSCSSVYGRVYDRKKKKNLLRRFPLKQKKISYFNFLFTHIAIVCFSKKKDIRMDERFGIGAKYFLGEEYDYLFKLIKAKARPLYVPSIQVWHPPADIGKMSNKKTYQYAYGFGAIMRKHLNGSIFYMFLLTLIFQMLSWFKYLISFKGSLRKKRWQSTKGRIMGFCRYEKLK